MISAGWQKNKQTKKQKQKIQISVLESTTTQKVKQK